MKKITLSLFIIVLASTVFAQKDAVKCQIWKPKSFCDMPDSINTFSWLQCNSCTWYDYKCNRICTKRFTGVWLSMTGNWTTLTLNHDSTFSLTSYFKNVTLTKKNGKIIHPRAILLDGFPSYTKSRFKAKQYLVTYSPKKKFDLFLIFKDAEQGDRLKIEGFIDTEIK